MNSDTTNYYPAARGLFLVSTDRAAAKSAEAAASSASQPKAASAGPHSIWAASVLVSLCLAGVALAAHVTVEQARVGVAQRNSVEISTSPGTP